MPRNVLLQRFLLPYVWPVIAGVLIAAALLLAFPERLPNPFADPSPPAPEGSEAAPAAGDAAPERTAPQIQEAAPLARDQGPASYADAVSQAAPAVVNVYSSRIVERDQHPLMSDPFFEQFFDNDDTTSQQRMLSSLGSGVIVSQDGYVLTNHHVIQGADQIQVALRDGRETLANVIGTDPESDLAVLRIPLDNLPSIKLSDSEEVTVGDVALAIGNP